MKLEGEIIPQSNISDLISDALRARKNFNPTGSKEFFRVLSKINMPKDLVRNEERWKESRMDHSFSEEGSLLDSPGASTSSMYFQNLLKRREKKQASQNKLRNVGLNINLVIVYLINCFKNTFLVLCYTWG